MSFVVGIDVSKDKVDGAFAVRQRRRQRTPRGRLQAAWQDLQAAGCPVVMEASGGYERLMGRRCASSVSQC